MYSNQRRITTLVLLASSVLLAASFAFTASEAANGDEPNDLYQAVQGKWVRYQATPNGRVKIIKEHKAQLTIVTAYDDKDNVIHAHESEFKIEQSGKVRIFTFFNRKITAGPNAGQKSKESVSFVYRVTENRFIEVYGVLDGDTNAPNMIIWERIAGLACRLRPQPCDVPDLCDFVQDVSRTSTADHSFPSLGGAGIGSGVTKSRGICRDAAAIIAEQILTRIDPAAFG